MALMSRKVDYALLILSRLHHKARGCSSRDIADHYQLSRAFVANILKELCQHGFVASHRGAKGGYCLQRSAGEINLAELMDALDDPFHLAECTRPPDDEGCCRQHACPVREPIAALHRRLRETLRGVTLLDLLDTPAPCEELVAVGILVGR